MCCVDKTNYESENAIILQIRRSNVTQMYKHTAQNYVYRSISVISWCICTAPILTRMSRSINTPAAIQLWFRGSICSNRPIILTDRRRILIFQHINFSLNTFWALQIVMIHYEEALYQVYGPLPFTFVVYQIKSRSLHKVGSEEWDEVCTCQLRAFKVNTLVY